MPTGRTSVFSRIQGAWERFKRWCAGDEASWTIYRQLQHFFGSELKRLETHHKQFPGFDLASLNLALDSLLAESCTFTRRVGAFPCPDVRQFLASVETNAYFRVQKAGPPVYQRVPTDVEEEISVVVNSLYLAQLRPTTVGDATARDSAEVEEEKIAVVLMCGASHTGWEEMGNQHAPQQQVIVSISCRARSVANQFFRDLEARRQRLSVYRGKVIDPVLQNGIIHTIGFRAIKRVQAADLILEDDVRELIQTAVVGFYDQRELLQSLEIELKRGILLFGPPGTGKTSICLYLAGLLPHFTVCFVSGERLLYPRKICRMARYLQPAMVVFEDIDLIATARDANGLATVLGELMNQIDGCEPTDQVLFLMNTNSLERLESAVRNRPGRVDQIVEIPLPNADARRRLLAHFGRKVALDVSDWSRVVEATAGTTPAMLKEIVKRAAVSAVECNGGRSAAITIREADLLLAAQQVQAMREPIAIPGRLGFRESPA